MKSLGFVGWSGAGKTTLIEQLVRALVAEGLSVSLIKHTHHDFDLDQAGKDSYRYRDAGAAEVVLAGLQRWALLHERRSENPECLSELLGRLAPCDLVLVEGFKTAAIPKIEVFRQALGKPLLFPSITNVIAIASDGGVSTQMLPVLPLNDLHRIAAFVRQFAHAS